MSLLGDWVARILIDISKVGPTLSSANGEWDKYYSRIQKKDDEITKYLQRSIYDLKGIETKNRQHAYEEYVKLNTKEKKQVEERVKSFMAASNQIAAEEKKLTAVKQAEAKKQIKEQNAIIAQNERQAKQLQAFQLQISKYATIAITVPISFLFKEGLQEYMEFTQQMQNIKAVVGATNQEMRMLTNTAITMSEKFASSPIDVAKAMFDLGQAGLEADEIYKQIGPVMTLAAAGMKDVSFTAEMVVTTLKAFNLSSEDSSRVADVFASSNAKSVSSLDKLSASLKYTAGLWSSMDWSLEGLVGTLDTLYDTGVRGEKAGRLLASAINGLLRPSASATKAIEKLLGYSSALDPAFNDITDIIKKMAEAHATTRDVVRIFGKESAEVINRLIQNYTLLDGNIAEVTGNIGESARQAAIQMDTLKGKTSILVNTFSNITKSFASTMDPALKSIVSGFTAMIKPMEKAPNLIKAIVVSFLAVVAVVPPLSAAFIGLRIAMTAAFGSMAAAGAAIGAMLGPVGLVVAGVTALSSAYVYTKKKQQDWIDSVDSGISALAKQGKSIDNTVKSIRTLFAESGDSKDITKTLYELADVFPKLRDQLNKNASDTAAAMRVLNDEYAKLKKIESDRSKIIATQGNADPLEDSIIKQQSEVAKLSANYESLIANTREFKATQNYFSDTGAGELAKDFATLEKNVKNGKINVDKLKEAFGDDVVTVFLSQIRDTNIELEDANKLLQLLKNKRISVKTDGIDVSLKMLEQVDTMIEDATSSVRNIKFTMSLKDKKATADDIGKAINEAIDDGLKNVVLDNPINMKSLGILSESGEIGSFYKAEFQNMKKQVDATIEEFGSDWWDQIQNDFSSKSGGNEINFSGSISKLQEDLVTMQTIESEMAVIDDKSSANYKDKAKLLTDLSSKYMELFSQEEKTLTNEQKQLRNTLLLLGVINEKWGDASKGPKETLDWWDQIVNKLQEYIDTLKGSKGKNISSMTKRLEELRNQSGESFDEIKRLTVALNESFANDPDLASLSKLVTLNNMLELTESNIEAMKLSMAEAFGMPVQVEKFKAQANSLKIQRNLLVQAQSLVSEGTKEWEIYQKSIEGVDDAMLNLAGNSGAISAIDFNASKFSDNASDRIREINDMENAYKNLGDASVDVIRLLVGNLQESGGFKIDVSTGSIPGAVKELKALSKAEEELDKKEKELNIDLLRNKKTFAEYKVEMEKITEAKDEASDKKLVVFEGLVKVTSDFAGRIKTIIDSVKQYQKSIRDIEQTSFDVSNSFGTMIMSMGNAVSFFNKAIGVNVIGVGAIFQVIGSLGSLFGIFEREEKEETVEQTTREVNNFADALRNAADAAENAMQEGFTGVGNSLGQFINDGFEEGIAVTAEKMTESFKKYMFQMISSALITASGFEDQVAQIAETLWGKISPSSVKASTLKKELSELYSGFTTKEAVSEVQNLIISYQKQEVSEQATLKKEQEAHNLRIKNMQDELDGLKFYQLSRKATLIGVIAAEEEAYRLKKISIAASSGVIKAMYLSKMSQKTGKEVTSAGIKSLQSIIDRINTLEAEIASTEIKVSAEGLSDEDLKTLNDKSAEYALLIESLATSLGMSSEKIDEEINKIGDSISSGLASAVLTGSYSDFKKAVYDVIVSNITKAVVESAGVTTRIQSLVSQIMNAGLDFTSEDANSLLNEVRAVWSEVTDDSTPLGSILMGLRDALSEFGLLDINVNPGTVVTAIPSSVRDDLITAIQGTMDNLSSAIAEAGLNSHIDIVNITTAYIESMTADMISISQANLNMSGSMIFQMSNGESFETWLENWFTAYLAKSGG